MKNLLLLVPSFMVIAALWLVPKPQATYSIDSLSLTSEDKAFTKPLYAEGSFIGQDGNAYYSLGENNYQSSDGDVYYGYGQNTYVGSDGDTTYNGLGGVGGVGGQSGHNFPLSSLQRAFKGSERFPQPRLALALR